MSADNGIYVLFTESEKGPEYRVAYAQAIDSIYGKFNEETFKYEGNAMCIQDTFQGSAVFHTIDEALNYAEELEQEYNYLEDGICVINEFKDYGYLFG
jgi:hypothetical protein